MPLLSLWCSVDTGRGKLDVEIECPIIDEHGYMKPTGIGS
jgi:hypothetical protein